MDKGALRAGEKSSRGERDRQGHPEQGGPDRERERGSYYSIYLRSQLLHTSSSKNGLVFFFPSLFVSSSPLASVCSLYLLLSERAMGISEAPDV